MKEYVVDFTRVKTYWSFYEALIKGLEFPDWCGKNMDAIWDLLTGYMDFPAHITIKGLSFLPKEFKEEKDLLIKVLNRAAEWEGKDQIYLTYIE